MFGLFNNEKDKAKENELKRLRAMERRLKDLNSKYTETFERGRSKIQLLAVLKDIDNVIGEKNK